MLPRKPMRSARVVSTVMKTILGASARTGRRAPRKMSKSKKDKRRINKKGVYHR